MFLDSSALYRELLIYLFDLHNTLEHFDGNIFGSKIHKNESLNIKSREDIEILKCSQKLESSTQHL